MFRFMSLAATLVLFGCSAPSDDSGEATDEGKTEDSAENTAAVDGDGDGVSAAEGDCDDGDASVAPGADEVCDDGVDSDCDGEIDAQGESCADALGCTQGIGCDATDGSCTCTCDDGSHLAWEVSGVCGDDCPMNDAPFEIFVGAGQSGMVSCPDELALQPSTLWPGAGG